MTGLVHIHTYIHILSFFQFHTARLLAKYRTRQCQWCGLALTSLHRNAHSLIIAILYINTRSKSLGQSYAGPMEFEQRVILFISTNLEFTLLLAKYNNISVMKYNIC